jgi:adenylate cyclase
VNLASRLTALARPGSVLCDAATAADLGAEQGFVTVGLWRRPLRGLGLVEPFAVRRAAGSVPRPG